GGTGASGTTKIWEPLVPEVRVNPSPQSMVPLMPVKPEPPPTMVAFPLQEKSWRRAPLPRQPPNSRAPAPSRTRAPNLDMLGTGDAIEGVINTLDLLPEGLSGGGIVGRPLRHLGQVHVGTAGLHFGQNLIRL